MNHLPLLHVRRPLVESLETRRLLSGNSQPEPIIIDIEAVEQHYDVELVQADGTVALPGQLADGTPVTYARQARDQVDPEERSPEELDNLLNQLLDLWTGPQHDLPQNMTKDHLADVIQAIRTIRNYQLNEQAEAAANYTDALHEMLNGLNGAVQDLEGTAENIQELRDLIDSIHDIGEPETLLEIRDYIGQVGDVADDVTDLLDAMGASELEAATAIIGVLRPFIDADTGDAADIVRDLADILDSANSLNPIPGVSDLIDSYVEGMDGVANYIEDILESMDQSNNAVLLGWGEDRIIRGTNYDPNSALGHDWAQDLMESDQYAPFVPDDHPMTDWPTNRVPPGVKPAVALGEPEMVEAEPLVFFHDDDDEDPDTIFV